MGIAPAIWLLVGLLVATVAHEASHWLLAHRRGLPLTSVRLTPLGVAVTFPADGATPYVAFQAVIPVLVTWLVLFGWIAAPHWPGDGGAQIGSLVLSPPSFLAMITLVSIVMSAADARELAVNLIHRSTQALPVPDGDVLHAVPRV